MQNFEYKILNHKNIELFGSVQATNLEDAKLKLTNLGYKILELKEITTDKKPLKHLINFKFQGIQNSKPIDGNIEAPSFNQALIELTEKYLINVEKLADVNSTQEEFDESKIKINNFLKRLDFHSSKETTNTKNNLEEIYIFIDSLLIDFKHYFTDLGIEEIKNLQRQYIQIKNSDNKAQKVRILKSIFKILLNEQIYKKSASVSGLKYIFKETISIFHKISHKNAINLSFDKLKILLSTGSQIIREILFKELFEVDSSFLNKINFKEISQDLKSIGLIGTFIFFLAIFLVNLNTIKIQIPSIWYKVGVLFFSVYCSYNYFDLLSKFKQRIYIIFFINLLNLLILIKL